MRQLALLVFLGGCIHGAMEPAELLSIEQMVGELQKPEAGRPLVLFVGFSSLYEEKHIPGAINLGPGSTAEGLSALEAKLRTLPTDREIVIYCGCCPSWHCPNIRPALALARKLGFVHARVLEIPFSFRHDWVKPGLPVAQGG